MKNYFNKVKAQKCLFILCLCIGFQVSAQDTTSKDDQYGVGNRNNEIKLDVFDAAFFSAIDLSYERVNDLAIGYGASLFVNLRDSDDGYYEKFAFTPFIRFYFFNKQDFGARGLFLELFSKLASGEDSEILFDNSNEDTNYFDAALGMSIGKKWVNKRGFMLEISAGGGRNIGLDNSAPDFTFRGGISLGYRF